MCHITKDKLTILNLSASGEEARDCEEKREAAAASVSTVPSSSKARIKRVLV